jgi:hypothetical protein
MKHVICTFLLMTASLIATSQVITVTLTKCQSFSHDASISTIEAMNSDLIEYPYYTVGENVYSFDLNTYKLTFENQEGVFSYEITKVSYNSNVLDCIVFDGTGDVLFLLGETSSGEMQFLHGFTENGKVFGEFSMNEDFSYTIE